MIQIITEAELARKLFASLQYSTFFSLVELNLSSKPDWWNHGQSCGPGSLADLMATFIGRHSTL